MALVPIEYSSRVAMQSEVFSYIESMLSSLIDSIETIRRLELLSELTPSFETIYAKKKRAKYFNELLSYMIKSEIIIELAYEFAMHEKHGNEILFKMLEDKYRSYLSRIVFLAHLYDCLLKKSLSKHRLAANTSTIFHG